MTPGPRHVAIVMDGNGRWATERGLPRVAGHRAGANAARRVVRAAADLGIDALTLFAFSSDNWARPRPEVAAIFRLLRRFLLGEARRCQERGIRLSVIGRRDRLPAVLAEAVAHAEAATATGTALRLRIAVDYSARDAILRRAAGDASEPVPDVDLFLRPGGERRLSDFLLWESAYAELVFTDRRWPDFDRADLEAALADYRARDRRFGAVPAR
jgi:undecaprenyl diphosphate synthase